jgi:hypothetical protein
MFVNVYYNVSFARAPIGRKVEGYLFRNRHKNPRLKISDKLFYDIGKGSISAIATSWLWEKLEIFSFNAFWYVKEFS